MFQKTIIWKLFVLCTIAFLFVGVSPASGQEQMIPDEKIQGQMVHSQKIRVSIEQTYSWNSTSFEQFEDAHFWGREWKPSNQKITVRVDPNKLFGAELLLGLRGTVSSAPVNIEPETGRKRPEYYRDYQGSVNEWQALGAVKYKMFEYMAGYMDSRFSQDTVSDTMGYSAAKGAYQETTLTTSNVRRYRGVQIGAGVCFTGKTWFVHARNLWMPRLTRSDSFDQRIMADHFHGNMKTDANGLEVSLRTGMKVWRNIGATISYRARQLTTPYGNYTYGVVPFQVTERLTSHSLSFGITLSR